MESRKRHDKGESKCQPDLHDLHKECAETEKRASNKPKSVRGRVVEKQSKEKRKCFECHAHVRR